MHTPSTRILSALAYDLGREYDPTDPVCQALADAVMQSEHAMRIADDDGTYEKARQRQRRRERDRERAAIPDWFSALGTPDDGVRRMGIDEAGPHIAVDSERAAEPLPRGRSAGTARLAAVAYQL